MDSAAADVVVVFEVDAAAVDFVDFAAAAVVVALVFEPDAGSVVGSGRLLPGGQQVYGNCRYGLHMSDSHERQRYAPIL